jgi:hypothetical protein
VYSGTYGGYTITPGEVVYRYNLGYGGCHYHGNSAAISAGQYVCYSVDYYVSPDASDYLTIQSHNPIQCLSSEVMLCIIDL